MACLGEPLIGQELDLIGHRDLWGKAAYAARLDCRLCLAISFWASAERFCRSQRSYYSAATGRSVPQLLLKSELVEYAGDIDNKCWLEIDVNFTFTRPTMCSSVAYGVGAPKRLH